MNGTKSRTDTSICTKWMQKMLMIGYVFGLMQNFQALKDAGGDAHCCRAAGGEDLPVAPLPSSMSPQGGRRRDDGNEGRSAVTLALTEF